MDIDEWLNAKEEYTITKDIRSSSVCVTHRLAQLIDGDEKRGQNSEFLVFRTVADSFVKFRRPIQICTQKLPTVLNNSYSTLKRVN